MKRTKWINGVALAAAAICTLLAALSRTANSDLFMALSAGRDVAEGRLAQPDDWSWRTQGRVWINQSWLTGYGLYEVWRVAGDSGLLATRAALVVAMACGLMAWLRGRGIQPAAAAVSAALVMLVCHDFTSLRGNLLTLTLTPWLLWMLLRLSRGGLGWAAAVGLLLLIWSQLHGGVMFGLLATGLWLAVDGAMRVLRKPASAADWGGWLLLGAALVGSVVGAILIGPFGAAVFSESLRMTGQTQWRTIREWQSLIPEPRAFVGQLARNFSETGSFLLFLLAAALLRWRVPERRGVPGAATPPGEGGLWIWFDRLLALGAVVMAISGWRFIPLAAVAMAAPIARHLETWWYRAAAGEAPAAPSRIAGIAVTLLAAVAAALCYPLLALGYCNRHPFYPAESFLERQIGAAQLPLKAAQFLAINGVTGNCFHPYAAETSLRWGAPRVRVGCGGRAQQIYTEEELLERRRIEDPRRREPADMAMRRTFFDAHRIDILLISAIDSPDLLLTYLDSGEWTPAHYDGEFCVLLRPGPGTKGVLGALRAESEQVVPPEGSASRSLTAPMAATSPTPSENRLLCTSAETRDGSAAVRAAAATTTGGPNVDECRCRISAALAQSADPFLYLLMQHIARRAGSGSFEPARWFEMESARLEKLPADSAMAANVLLSRRMLASRLARIESAARRTDRAAEWQRKADIAKQSLDRLAFWWQF